MTSLSRHRAVQCFQADLRLLCPSGGCASVDDYTTCNLAKVPARALMGNAELQGSAQGDAIQSALVAAGKLRR